jgi:hypothetical protein
MKKVSGVVLLGCLISSPSLFGAENMAQLSASRGSVDVKLPASALFDPLGNRADVVYLVANSSLVFGPDPHGRSEEVTFIGPVTVPKWPMTGYGRRVLADGRQQIDIELTQSELRGESYVLQGSVLLGEHPDLRSLGTITERPGASEPQTQLAQMSMQNRSPEQVAQARDRLLGQAQSQATTEQQSIERNKRRLQEAIQQLNAPAPQGADRQRNFERAAPAVQSLLQDLSRARAVDTEVVPADFVVERKVLISTAKGILYNETAVPVRGRIDAIPPVKLEGTPTGVNVFRGMELPTPLLDNHGQVNGWFYSKSHMAYAVLPAAVQRAKIKGTVELKVGDKTEKVSIDGPSEVHFLTSPAKETAEVEVMMLGLRGRSELLGGDIMFTETFSDRDAFSRGQVRTEGDKKVGGLDLFVDLMTPSTKLATHQPLRLNGHFANADKVVDRIESGDLRLPVTAGSGHFESSASRVLYDEVERPIVEIMKIDINLVQG